MEQIRRTATKKSACTTHSSRSLIDLTSQRCDTLKTMRILIFLAANLPQTFPPTPQDKIARPNLFLIRLDTLPTTSGAMARNKFALQP
jgi:hypothetical protein